MQSEESSDLHYELKLIGAKQPHDYFMMVMDKPNKGQYNIPRPYNKAKYIMHIRLRYWISNNYCIQRTVLNAESNSASQEISHTT